MPQRALPKPPKIPKIPTIEEPSQLSPPEEVTPIDRIDRGDQRIGDRKTKDDSLRGQPGGPFISPYLHNLRRDPSRQEREDTEQKEQLRDLREQKREINEKINEIRNQDSRINPYKVNEDSDQTVDQMIGDLRNMGQSRWSGDLTGFREASPLYDIFKNQFSTSDEDEDNNLSGYFGYSPLHHRMREQFSVSEEDDDADIC
jgi:hypothetical protein